MNHPDHQTEHTQNLIKKITRLAGFGFLAIGLLVLLTGGDMILGSVLTLVGVADLIIVPHMIETIIVTKLKQKNEQNKG